MLCLGQGQTRNRKSFITRKYIHTYIQTYRHTDIQTYRHTDIQTYRHTDIHTYRHTHIHTYVHTYIRTYVRTYIHTYITGWTFMAYEPLIQPGMHVSNEFSIGNSDFFLECIVMFSGLYITKMMIKTCNVTAFLLFNRLNHLPRPYFSGFCSSFLWCKCVLMEWGTDSKFWFFYEWIWSALGELNFWEVQSIFLFYLEHEYETCLHGSWDRANEQRGCDRAFKGRKKHVF